MKQRLACALLVVGVLPGGLAEGRIKLAALPKRERVEIQLDNPRYTLVEEERVIPLLKSTIKRGYNRIDFSWSNTRIDKQSIQFRPIGIREGDAYRKLKKVDGKWEVNVVNVAYPPGENALVWEVFATKACAVKVRVSYLISNLTRSFSYRAQANKQETFLTLKKYIQLRNYSGESFGMAGIWAGFGPRFLKRIGQQEKIKILLGRFPKVPIQKVFTFDWYAHGALNPAKPLNSKVTMHYQLINDEKNGLGKYPLQAGKVRIFIADGHGGEAFLGEDWTGLTPLDGRMRLYLGEARDVVCKRTIKLNTRHRLRGNLFNQELVIRYELENFKKTAVTLDILEQINRLARQYGGRTHGDAEWELGDGTSKSITIDRSLDGTRPRLKVTLPARPKDPKAKVEKQVVLFHLTIKNIW
ncbi:DUF2712 domain-containing protein [Acidimicrobium ferrooxidans]|nr:DUF2712 domain-containing protein [Acidimicrobium ferrooxidans]